MKQWFKGFFKKKTCQKPLLYDFRNQARHCGPNCIIKPLGDNRHFYLQGYGHQLRESDVVIFAHPFLGWDAYRIDSIQYWAESMAAGSFYDDPRDMWDATATWLSRDVLNPFDYDNIRDFPDIKSELLAMRVGSTRQKAQDEIRGEPPV